MLGFVTLVLAALVAGATGAMGQGLDPHRIYEESCARCHAPHAGDFVWDGLGESGGVLTGARSGRPVAAYLMSGHGGLSPDEAEALLAHFRQVRNSGGAFMEKCRICHATAVELVRGHLIIDNGALTGRYTGRDIATFLTGHGRLTPQQAVDMLDVLTRVATTQGLVK